MTLVYRALWNDDRTDLCSSVIRTFSYWADNLRLGSSKALVIDPLEVDGAEVAASQVVISRDQSLLSVSASTLCNHEGQQILVEAERTSGASHRPFRGVLFQLIRDLIDDSLGVTGKIHVGFIGSHDLMPNSTANH